MLGSWSVIWSSTPFDAGRLLCRIVSDLGGEASHSGWLVLKAKGIGIGKHQNTDCRRQFSSQIGQDTKVDRRAFVVLSRPHA
jgi:hypothetical protein